MPNLGSGEDSYSRLNNPGADGYLNPCGAWADVGKFRDVWWAVLWAAGLAACLGKGALDFSNGDYFQNANDTVGETGEVPEETGFPVVAVAAASVMAVVLAVALIHLAKRFPVQVIFGCNIMMIFVLLAMAVWMYMLGSLMGVALFLICCAIHCCWFYCVQDRIPFAAQCLRNACQVNLTFWGTSVTAFFCTAALLLSSVATLFAISSPAEALPRLVLSYVFIFLLFWHEEVFRNVIHVTTVGVTAEWFFSLGGPGTPELYKQKNASPTVAAFKRASTWSLGSICFGSLFVAILKMIRFLLRQMRERNAALACIIDCILACLEDLIRYFNDYAFVQVGVYGKPYITAAKDTWALLMSGELWTSIMNDCLVDSVFTIFMLMGAGVTVLFVWATGLAKHCSGGDCESQAVGLIVAALVGLLIMALFMRLLYSSVMTTFICYADLASQGYAWQACDIGGESATMAQCLDEKYAEKGGDPVVGQPVA